MGYDEISEEGQRARFAQWEKLGLDQVKHDLLNGGHRVVDGPPQVRELAWQWVRKKETEEAGACMVRQMRRKEGEDTAAAASVVRQVSAFDPVADVSRGGDPIMDYDLRPVAPSKNLAKRHTPGRHVTKVFLESLRDNFAKAAAAGVVAAVVALFAKYFGVF